MQCGAGGAGHGFSGCAEAPYAAPGAARLLPEALRPAGHAQAGQDQLRGELRRLLGGVLLVAGEVDHLRCAVLCRAVPCVVSSCCGWFFLSLTLIHAQMSHFSLTPWRRNDSLQGERAGLSTGCLPVKVARLQMLVSGQIGQPAATVAWLRAALLSPRCGSLPVRPRAYSWFPIHSDGRPWPSFGVLLCSFPPSRSRTGTTATSSCRRTGTSSTSTGASHSSSRQGETSASRAPPSRYLSTYGRMDTGPFTWPEANRTLQGLGERGSCFLRGD